MAADKTDKPRVLVAEDNATNMNIMRGLLRKLDCEIVEAENGREALNAIEQYNFALILMDINMPEVDGYDVAKHLSLDSRKSKIPLIFVTGSFKDDLGRVKGYELGAVDYIFKPINPFVLTSKVKVFLELYHSHQRQQQLLRIVHKRNSQLEEEVRERQAAEERARHQASHDPLTDLPNRILFMDRLETAMARARRHDGRMGLLYVDLDRFKPVNDVYGHHAGDELLVSVARRLKTALRESDTVARLGGDEFAVVLEDVKDRDQANQVIEKLADELAIPFLLHTGEEEISVSVGASFGLALFPDDADEEEALLRFADGEMYQVKKERRSEED